MHVVTLNLLFFSYKPLFLSLHIIHENLELNISKLFSSYLQICFSKLIISIKIDLKNNHRNATSSKCCNILITLIQILVIDFNHVGQF
jgi:hypothetical protein